MVACLTLSVRSIEYPLEKGLNRLAVLFFFWHCTRHIRSTDMESFWIGKKETSPYHPCPSARLAKCIQILFCPQ